MFNMTLAYRSEEGEEIAQECIRRYRVKSMAGGRHKCMIVCGDQYGILDLEELMMLLGQPVRCPCAAMKNSSGSFTGCSQPRTTPVLSPSLTTWKPFPCSGCAFLAGQSRTQSNRAVAGT